MLANLITSLRASAQRTGTELPEFYAEPGIVVDPELSARRDLVDHLQSFGLLGARSACLSLSGRFGEIALLRALDAAGSIRGHNLLEAYLTQEDVGCGEASQLNPALLYQLEGFSDAGVVAICEHVVRAPLRAHERLLERVAHQGKLACFPGGPTLFEHPVPEHAPEPALSLDAVVRALLVSKAPPAAIFAMVERPQMGFWSVEDRTLGEGTLTELVSWLRRARLGEWDALCDAAASVLTREQRDRLLADPRRESALLALRWYRSTDGAPYDRLARHVRSASELMVLATIGILRVGEGPGPLKDTLRRFALERPDELGPVLTMYPAEWLLQNVQLPQLLHIQALEAYAAEAAGGRDWLGMRDYPLNPRTPEVVAAWAARRRSSISRHQQWLCSTEDATIARALVRNLPGFARTVKSVFEAELTGPPADEYEASVFRETQPQLLDAMLPALVEILGDDERLWARLLTANDTSPYGNPRLNLVEATEIYRSRWAEAAARA